MATIPQNVAFEQAKQEIANVINYCIGTLKVEPFMVETVLENLLGELHQRVEMDFQTALKSYQEEVSKEQDKAEEKSED